MELMFFFHDSGKGQAYRPIPPGRFDNPPHGAYKVRGLCSSGVSFCFRAKSFQSCNYSQSFFLVP